MGEAERAWKLHQDTADMQGEYCNKACFMAAWQKATERAAKIAEQEAAWLEGSFGRRCPLAEKIRQQESADGRPS